MVYYLYRIYGKSAVNGAANVYGMIVSIVTSVLAEIGQDEEAVTELSKLSARSDVYAHKIGDQNGKVANAEAELKAALAQFGISSNTLFLTLRGYVLANKQ